jgi:transposase
VRSDNLFDQVTHSEERNTVNDAKTRRRYNDAFKRQAVQMLIESGKPVTTVAQTMGIDRTNLQKWKRLYSHEFVTKPVASSGNTIHIDELSSLKKEFESMKETVDRLRTIVKKTLTNKYSEEV